MAAVEVWKIIGEAPNYSVSSLGRVRNRKTRKLLKPSIAGNGYPKVCLYLEPRNSLTRSIHRLVAIAFHTPPMAIDDLEVNHINGNKFDNSVGNLEWSTVSQNRQHAYDTGLRNPPNQKPMRIVETGEVFYSVSECARYLGGQQSHITECLNGKANRHKGYTFEYVVE